MKASSFPLALLIALLGFTSQARAQYYSRQHKLDVADHELDKAAWQLYHSSNQLDYADKMIQTDARATEQRRQASLKQNVNNQANANRIQWQAQLLDQAARINAANAQQLAQARATLAAESQRVEQGSRDCEKGLAALLVWRDQIAKRHADNQTYFKQRESNSGLGQKIVSDWAKLNAERDVHLREDLAKIREKQSDLDRREDLLADKLSDLDESERALTRIEASLAASAEAQASQRASLLKRKTALASIKASLDKRAEVVFAKTKSNPPVKPAAPSEDLLSEFMKYRKEVNTKTEGTEWKTITHELPSDDGHKRYVKGWLAGNSLQRLMHVDKVSETNSAITFYYWRDGKFYSVFQVRKGDFTHLDGVAECTETYNFIDEKLVAWKHTPSDDEGLMNPKSEGFAKEAKRVYDNSVRYAQPIYEAMEAK